MGFDIARPIKRQAGLLIDMTYQVFLCLDTRLREHRGVAVLVRADGPDDGANCIAVSHSRSYRLEH